MSERILGRYDAAAVRGLLAGAGVLEALAKKGFTDIVVAVESAGRPLPHILLSGRKDGRSSLLLEACVGEAVIRPDWFARRGFDVAWPVDLAVLHWVREQDPTASFAADRPRLPLQQHPGLGVLRRAFRVIVEMAGDLGKDGVANVPKFFHDAAIFFRSRLFLFLDADEQGRFESLLAALRSLSLGDASVALAGGCVRDRDAGVVRWYPGYQVFPISESLRDYFNSPGYAAQVAAAGEQYFSCDAAAVAQMCAAVAGARRV